MWRRRALILAFSLGEKGLEGNVDCTDNPLSRWERVRVRGRKLMVDPKAGARDSTMIGANREDGIC